MANSQNTVDGDLSVRGVIRARSIAYPDDSIGDAAINPASPIAAVNQEHQYPVRYSQAKGSGVAAVTGQAVHVATGDGTIVAARAGILVAAVGDSTVAVNVKLNGTTILTGTISITSGLAAFDTVDGVLATTTYVADGVFEVVVTPTVGTGTLPQGLFIDLLLREAAG